MGSDYLEKYKNIAIQHGGKCLSEKYINSQTRLLFECSKGHRWQGLPYNIQSGRWCAKCSGNLRLSIEDMQSLAKSRGGKCLSKKYINTYSKLLWECSKGHHWNTVRSVIKRGSWCPYCAGKIDIKTIDDMKELAEERGGKCLSDKYASSHNKLEWQCDLGHRWEAVPYSIIKGTWCPICAGHQNENLCRVILEKMFTTPFIKQKPSWLIASTGEKLELDGFSEKLKLAFEYQGQQHYNLLSHFHKFEHFQKREWLDSEKLRISKKNGVSLLIIPYTVGIDNLQKYIFDEVKVMGFEKYITNYKILISPADIYSSGYLARLQRIANTKGGTFLSDYYTDKVTKMKWKCKYGHIWEAKPSDIIRDSWCHICWRQRSPKYKIEDMQKLANERGGVCLSSTYMLNNKLLWKCKYDHQWMTTPDHIKRGQWCRKCGYKSLSEKLRKYDIIDMRSLAEKKGGQCLSNEFLSTQKKLIWLCDKRHKWKATPTHVQRGSWCPKCAGSLISQKKTIYSVKDMQALASVKRGNFLSKEYSSIADKYEWECELGHRWIMKASSIKNGAWCQECINQKALTKMKKIAIGNGGQCISTNYVNDKSKLKWQCNKGHIWEAVPSNVKRGTWCPVCRRKKYRQYN